MPPVNAIAQFIPGCGLYKIDYSARFRGAQYLSRTYADAPTNKKIGTLAFWCRRAKLGAAQVLFAGWDGTSLYAFQPMFLATDQLSFDFGGASAVNVTTAQVFRDTTAHYFIVLRWDTTQSTASQRVKIEVNGVEVSSFAATNYPAQNSDLQWALPNGYNRIGTNYPANGGYLEGYLSAVFYVDGASVPSTNFGQFMNGVWVPKDFTGSYGANGFRLQFKNSAALGTDTSGNSNTWTVTGLLSTDQMTDTPTSVAPTLNPLYVSGGTLSNANLTFDTGAASTEQSVITTHATPSSGSWAWEVTVASLTSASVGVTGMWGAITPSASFYNTASGYSYRSSGEKVTNGTFTAYGAAYTAGDVIGHVYDADAGTLTFYKNGVSQGVAFTGIPAIGYFPAVCDTGSTVSFAGSANFGQRPLVYAYGSAKPLSTANAKQPTTKPVISPSTYFAAATYTGNGTTQDINLGFQPDLAWVKSRSLAQSHTLSDSVRGAGVSLYSNLTNAETANDTGGYVSAFTATGITVSAGSSNATMVNASGATYVVWGWKAGGAPATNTAGTITSQVSANPEAGFSVVTYTGTGANATVGHGLGTTPTLIILKRRDNATDFWRVYHASIGATGALALNSTNTTGTSSIIWNNTSPTASVFSIGTETNTNAVGSPIVAYCFSDREGYLKTGKYTGNGSADGPFVYCGFRPRFVMIKCSSNAGNWYTFDCARDLYNPCNKDLLPNSSAVEGSITAAQYPVDILADGFKMRTSANNELNGSGLTYIFLAIAEQPLVGQCNVPSNAR